MPDAASDLESFYSMLQLLCWLVVNPSCLGEASYLRIALAGGSEHATRTDMTSRLCIFATELACPVFSEPFSHYDIMTFRFSYE